MADKLPKDKLWTWPAEAMSDWTQDELATNERDFGERILRLRFEYSTGQTSVLATLRQLRKGMARLKTVRRAKEIEKAKAR